MKSTQLTIAPSRPWPDFRAYVIDPQSPEGLRVYCECPGYDSIAYERAKHIVLCVNSHDDLLKELKHLVRYFDQLTADDVVGAKAAIAKAEGRASN